MQPLMICTVMLAATLTAADAHQREGVERAKEFWAAVAAADTDVMRQCYAENVVLRAGCELLKPQWGLPGGGDRQKELSLDRDELVAGYGRMIEQIGRERWAAIFTKIDPEKISLRFAESADKKRGIESGDLTMTVVTGPGDDELVFFLRHDTKAGWQVVAEATDY